MTAWIRAGAALALLTAALPVAALPVAVASSRPCSSFSAYDANADVLADTPTAEPESEAVHAKDTPSSGEPIMGDVGGANAPAPPIADDVAEPTSPWCGAFARVRARPSADDGGGGGSSPSGRRA